MTEVLEHEPLHKPWTPEEDTTIRQCFLAGLSASEIANQLASGRTRNAVIGRLHRMGLVKKSAVPVRYDLGDSKPAKTRREPQERPKPSMPSVPKVIEAIRAPQPVIAVTPLAAPPAKGHVRPHELEFGMCKWPIGDPCTDEFRHCGASQGERAPYCDHHAAIAYVSKGSVKASGKRWKFQHMGGRAK